MDEIVQAFRDGYKLGWSEASQTGRWQGLDALEKRANYARKKVGVHPRDGGPYSLFCFDCEEWVPNTATAEMRGEGAYAHSHICGMKKEK